jgi:hypothetical protein
MDRPQHRRLILLSLAFLAGGALLLLARPWTSAPDPVPVTATTPASQVVAPQPDKVEPPPIEAVAPSLAAPPPPPSEPTPSGLRGRIIDAVTRQPVKEFEVRLIRVGRDGYTQDEPITRSFKSASGRFIWADLAAGTWHAGVSAPGYQMFKAEDLQVLGGEPTRELVMPLMRGFAVRGRVFELSTGAGIADAGIGFRPASVPDGFDRLASHVKSKEDGSFMLDGVPGGDVILTAGARDHAYRELLIVVDEKTPAQEIVLSTGATIAGAVTTTAGVPIKGRLNLGGPGPSYFMETDEAGQFSFKHMPPGRYRLSVDTSAGSATEAFMLKQDEVKQGIALIVGAGRSVRGMVRGLRPDQFPKAHILLRSESKEAFLSARPDEKGAYSFTGVPPGRSVIIVYGASQQFEKQVDVPADQDVTLDLIFPTGARLSGRVTHGGKPHANKNVWMRRIDSRSDVLYRARTSEEGLYEIEGLPPGDYRMRADEDISRVITMAGDAVLNIDIPSVQLAGRVVEEGGTLPLVDANVIVRGSAPETARVSVDKQTDGFGQFALTGIEPGEIVLQVYKPGYELHREKIAYSSPITDRTITLRKSAGVEVRVQPGSRRFPRGFTITQTFPGNDYVVDLWIPLERDGICRVPAALAGTTFEIGRFSGQPILFENRDGQPFELP